MKLKCKGVGWKSRIILKRNTFNISISKLVAIGCGLEKGKVLYSYLYEDEKERVVMTTYLDGGRKGEFKGMFLRPQK